MFKRLWIWKPIITYLILTVILCLAFWIRIQGLERIPARQFTSNDAYLYSGQGDEIAKRGFLPARDMHRWLPLGRDNRQLLSLYSYAIAYFHKALGWFFPKLTRYHIQIYITPICFTLGIGVLFIFFSRIYGIIFASIVAVLLATMPGSIERSAAGFGDRDAWCWMLGVFAVTSYLWKEQILHNPFQKEEKGGKTKGRKNIKNWRRYFATVFAGFIVFLGGLSWEGFGIFVLIIIAAELWKFCTTDTEAQLKEYVLWMLMFVPGLYLISPAYRSGYGFSTHVAAIMLFPPLAVLVLRCVRYLSMKVYPPLRSYARKFAWGLTLSVIAIGVGYILLQADTFETTAYTFRENSLMKSIGELVDPHFGYWKARYGGVFVLGSLGLIFTSLQLWKWKGFPLALVLTLFTATTFFRWPVSNLIGASTCNVLFLISFALTGVCLSIATLRKDSSSRNELVTIAALVWFILWVGLARSGKRHDFFIGVPLAFFTASFLQFLLDTFSHKLRHSQYTTDKFRQDFTHVRIQTGGAAIFLICVLFWPTTGGHALRSLHAATEMRAATPGYSHVNAAFAWMRIFLLKQVEKPDNVVVAASWRYGCQLNVLGGVKTIIDQDHYLPHWISLYNQHVYNATSEREALEFLKTHKATHIMLTSSAPQQTFLNANLSDAFMPLYPKKNFAKAKVKIWEIHYPPDIKTDEKYLATEPENANEK